MFVIKRKPIKVTKYSGIRVGLVFKDKRSLKSEEETIILTGISSRSYESYTSNVNIVWTPEFLDKNLQPNGCLEFLGYID